MLAQNEGNTKQEAVCFSYKLSCVSPTYPSHMPETSKERHYPVEPAERNEGDWVPCERLDGSQYHVKMRAGDEPSSLLCTLVVDDWRQKPTADNKSNSLSSSSCEEAYFRGEDEWLLIIHSSQTAWYLVQHKEADMKTKQKLYWTYISTHPAHAERSMAGWMATAHKQALVYLKWCSFEALTSSTAKTPFPLKHSQDIANLLRSLPEDSADAETLAASEVLAVDTQASSSQAADRRLHSHGKAPEVSAAESAARESYKLQKTLIAKVLAAKYSQQGAVDASSETNRPAKPSKALDALFWIVDFASLGSFLRYLRRLEEVRDTLLTDDQWRDHIWRLVKEWEEFNLISTVLLSASAGILALNNIGGVPRTAILISILSAFGSITTGLYCISMYQPRAPNSRDSVDRTNAMDVFQYTQYTLTHKGIALVLGLPMAFLVWSLASFMVGIIAFNIVGTETSGHVSPLAYAVVSVAAAVFLLIALAFYSLSRLWGSRQGGTLLGTIREHYMKVIRHWRPLNENEKSAA
ncbi:hypothetical protein B0H13DRAFT_2171324 [Mycena leptocephala]|nr:hypothetical protein B0H13DRAFT_2171324 [Mycena leptocephala]